MLYKTLFDVILVTKQIYENYGKGILYFIDTLI